ncbi:hypothetical protein [Streptomyces sp. NBC_01244]|uniref:hypothetical protein n=1 Tax=Streptomyces sp. NBC_01244 TaxID=2903797 RepID=UPI002E157C0D|nr:hypothetical protein OG247_41345 [Streptomyces sp. NBC_01244]
MVVGSLIVLGVVVACATAAVVVVWLAMRGTDSRHRAAVLRSAAEIVLAIRGRRRP